MYINAEDLKFLLAEGKIDITPLSDDCFKQVSYTFRSGSEITIQPGEFTVIESLEKITFPDNIVGILSTRGSIAKLGLDCLLTDTVIEPGSIGKLTFCTVNHSKDIVTIKLGTPIVKCLFVKIET